MLGVNFERDQNLIDQTKSVMSLMKDIADEEDRLQGYVPIPKFSVAPYCAPLSFEEAIRELYQMQMLSGVKV